MAQGQRTIGMAPYCSVRAGEIRPDIHPIGRLRFEEIRTGRLFHSIRVNRPAVLDNLKSSWLLAAKNTRLLARLVPAI